MSVLKICFSKLSIQQKEDTCPEEVRKEMEVDRGRRQIIQGKVNIYRDPKKVTVTEKGVESGKEQKGTKGLCDSKEKMCRAIIVRKTLEWDT